jgi:3',5'-cyclic AMP phosphodiesterase CpdA
MKFGILSDLHLGQTGSSQWHNRLLFDQAETVVRAAVDVLNGQALDAVFVLGDITQSGEERQLALACDLFDGFTASWFAIPGNHDRPAMRTGTFDRKFAGHLIPDFFLYDGLAIVGLREQVPDGDPDAYLLESRKVAELLQQVERKRPETLLLFSHMPLTSGAAWAAEHQGKDAGCLEGGEALLNRLGELTGGRVAAFSGHQRFRR